MLACWLIVIKYKRSKMLESKFFQETYGNTIEEGTNNNAIGHYWRIFISARWILTCCIMILLRNYPSLQIIILFIASVLIQTLLLIKQPFSSRLDNRMTLFNEVATSGYLYILLLLTDYNPTQISRERFSNSLAFLVCSTVGVNTIIALPRIYASFLSAYNYIKSKCQRKKSGENTIPIKPNQLVDRTVN